METVLIVVIAVVLGAALIGGIVFATMRFVGRVGAKSEAEIDELFDESVIELRAPMANFFGRTSQGKTQLRGNGPLVATTDQIWFRRIGANDALEIPRVSITATEIVSSHLGKSVGRPLLKVTFRTPDGSIDDVAWYVPDAHGWASALEPTPPA